MYISPLYQAILSKNKLGSFEQLWDYHTEWQEAPNQARGGWSGVCSLELMDPRKNQRIFLKRQQNYTRRSFWHPLRGESTFAREFKIIAHLKKNGLLTPNVVFFEERCKVGAHQAILVTENLDGFVPFENFSPSAVADGRSLQEQRRLLSAMAKAVRKLHDVHVQYRSLYPKHLFIRKNGNDYDVAMIDLEKSRLSFVPLLRTFSDLVTLNYRTQGWSRTSRLYFFKQYLGVEKLAALHKILCRWIVKKSTKKLNKQEI